MTFIKQLTTELGAEGLGVSPHDAPLLSGLGLGGDSRLGRGNEQWSCTYDWLCRDTTFGPKLLSVNHRRTSITFITGFLGIKRNDFDAKDQQSSLLSALGRIQQVVDTALPIMKPVVSALNAWTW